MSIWNFFGEEKPKKVVPPTEQQQRYEEQQKRDAEIIKMAKDAYTDDEQDPLEYIGAKAQSYDSNKAIKEAKEFDEFRESARLGKKERIFRGLDSKQEFIARQILKDLEELYNSLPKIGPHPSFQEMVEKEPNLSLISGMIRELKRSIDKKQKMNALQESVKRLKNAASALDKNVMFELRALAQRGEITDEESQEIYLNILKERETNRDYLSKGDWGGVFGNTENYVKKEIKRQKQKLQNQRGGTKKDADASWFGW